MNRRHVKISVVMACHNSSAYMDEAINSILSQTLADLELILIDDCSTDNTLEIARRYQVYDDRVSVITLPVNLGPANARNAGIGVARGEWLGILDSDDVAMPSRFEEQIRLANGIRDLNIIGSNSVSITAKGTTIKHHKYPTSHNKLVKHLVRMRAFPPHSSLLYKMDIVQKISSFNPRYGQSEDYDLCLRLSEVGKLASVGEALVKIRKHKSNMSDSQEGIVQTHWGNVAAVCHFLRIHGHPDPSTSQSEEAWQFFLEWVERRIGEEGVFKKSKVRAGVHKKLLTTENGLNAALRVCSHLLHCGNASALIWEKFFGSALPRNLAQEWMRLSCASS